jgi:hypothetical protein
MKNQRVKLFESFVGESLTDEQSYEFPKNEVDIEFYNHVNIQPESNDSETINQMVDYGLAPGTQEIEDFGLSFVKIRYTMKPQVDRTGIYGIDLELRSVYMVGTYTLLDDSKYGETSYEFEIEDLGPFDGRVIVEYGGLPFYPYDLEINTNFLTRGGQEIAFDPQNPDPSKYTYKIKIGD